MDIHRAMLNWSLTYMGRTFPLLREESFLLFLPYDEAEANRLRALGHTVEPHPKGVKITRPC